MKVRDIIGQTLGHYRLVESIGAGGMGQVYRAHDERLERDVALKVLPPDALGTETARLRFRRGALALSRLNHPNIAIIYDFDTQNDIDFLVMEYVNGSTLDQKLIGGPLAEREVIRVGAQIARALEEAHENGVIHRDLKPANVMVTPKGVVKVLDFGLAGIMGEDQSDATRSTRVTMAVGTPPYMPPEILRGKTADARSDIWALGATLYEMASGRPPFKGRSGFELGEAILNQEPEPLGPEISPPLRTIIGTCLAKSPEERYQNVGEARASLESLSSGSDIVAVELPRRRRFTWAAAALAGLGLLAVVLALLLAYLTRAPRFGSNEQLVLLLSTEGRIQGAVLSPDGKMVAYAAEEDGHSELYLNRVAGGGRVRLPDDAFVKANPTFSPDGEHIAYERLRDASSSPEIATIPTLGGEVTSVIAYATHPRWSPDGSRIAYVSTRPGKPNALATAMASGADERILLTADDIYPRIKSLDWSPDGRAIVITRTVGGMAGEIWLVPTDAGAARKLSRDPANVFSQSAIFAPDGRGIIHESNRGGSTNLWVLPLHGGAPYRLTTGAGPDENPSVTRDGTVAFINSHWRWQLLLYDTKTGAKREIVRHPGYVWAPAFSRDGRQLAYSYFENMKQWQIWVTSIDAGSPRRLTGDKEDAIYPRFAADGRTLTYCNWPEVGRIWRIPSEGGLAQTVTSNNGDCWADVSPDGRSIAFARTEGKKVRVYIAPLGGGEARRLTDSPSTLPRWSPDGAWLLYCADRTYSGGIFVIRPDGSGERRVTENGAWGVWWPDGKSIGYLTETANGTQELRLVPLSGGESKLIGNVRWANSNNPIDVSPDGKLIATGDGVHLQDDIWVLKSPK